MAKKKKTPFVRTKQAKTENTHERLIYRITDKISEQRILVSGIVFGLIGLVLSASFFNDFFPEIVRNGLLVIKQGAGWGSILLGPYLMIFGVWLGMNAFDKGEWGKRRVFFGAFILLIMTLIGIHFLFAGNNFGQISAEIAKAGQGGGWIGYFLLRFLGHGLGVVGTVILMLAGILLSVGLLINRTLAEMTAFVQPIIDQLIQNLINLRYKMFPPRFKDDFKPVYPEAILAEYDGIRIYLHEIGRASCK